MTALNNHPAATTSTQEETMTSTQIASIIGYEKKEVNRKIKEMFPVEIDGGEIPPSLDSRGYIAEYHLSELHSTMFVGRWHTPFLRQLAEFWLKRKDIQKALESKNAQPAQPVEIDYDRIVKTVLATLKEVKMLKEPKAKKKKEPVTADNAFKVLETRLINATGGKKMYKSALAQKLKAKKFSEAVLSVAGKLDPSAAVDVVIAKSEILKADGNKVFI